MLEQSAPQPVKRNAMRDFYDTRYTGTSPAPAVMSAGASRERSERDLYTNRIPGEGADG